MGLEIVKASSFVVRVDFLDYLITLARFLPTIKRLIKVDFESLENSDSEMDPPKNPNASKRLMELTVDANTPLSKPELEMLHAQTLITMRESQQKTEEIKAIAQAKTEELQNQIKLKEVEAKAREAENVRMQLEIEKQKMELENQIKLKQAENAQIQIQFQKQQLDLEKARLDNERLRENQDQILDQARAEESLLSKRLLAYENRFRDLGPVF